LVSVEALTVVDPGQYAGLLEGLVGGAIGAAVGVPIWVWLGYMVCRVKKPAELPPGPPTILDSIDEGNIEAVKQHLDTGTNVNVKDGVGTTPLHYAAKEGHKEIVELLINKGAHMNVKENLFGYTPLDSANGETADLLRKHGGKTSEELKAEGK